MMRGSWNRRLGWMFLSLGWGLLAPGSVVAVEPLLMLEPQPVFGPTEIGDRILAADGVTLFALGREQGELWRTDGPRKEPRLVRQFGSPRRSADLHLLAATSRRVLFTVQGSLGLELWGTDGTTEGTELLIDLPSEFIGFAYLDAVPSDLLLIPLAGGERFGVLDRSDLVNGFWFTDGTAEGTERFSGDASSGPLGVFTAIPFGDDLLLGGRAAGSSETLYRVDPLTGATTQLLAVPTDSWISDLTPGPGRAFFFLNSSLGREIWRTDGTVAGTERFWVPPPAWSNAGSDAPRLAADVSGEGVFVRRQDLGPSAVWYVEGPGAPGAELFETDLPLAEAVRSLPEGNLLLALDASGGRGLLRHRTGEPLDALASSCGAACDEEIGFLGRLGDRVLVGIPTPQGSGGLWVSDGSRQGTRSLGALCAEPCAVGGEGDFVELGDRAVVLARGSDGFRQPVLTDGTPAGTVELPLSALASRPSRGLTNAARFARFELNGQEWITAVQTEARSGRSELVTYRLANQVLVASFPVSGPTLSEVLPGGPPPWTPVDATLAAATRIGFQNQGLEVLAWTDGSAAGTFTQEAPGVRPGGLRAPYLGGLLFEVDGGLAWVEGPSAVPERVLEFPPGLSFPRQLATHGERILVDFAPELLIADAFGANPRVLDASRSFSSLATAFYDGSFYFQRTSSELLRTNAAGTGVEAIDLTAVLPSGFDNFWLSEATVVGDRLFFSTFWMETETVLWSTDGTQAGTRLVDQEGTWEADRVGNWEPVSWAGSLYYRLMSSRGGFLSRQDPASATPLVLREFTGTRQGSPSSLTPAGEHLYFVAEDPEHGRELWITDGTGPGTRRVADLFEGTASSDPAHLTAFGDRVFFSANGGATGRELWVSDGTPAGTFLFEEIAPGPAGSNPEDLLVLGDRLLFTAWTEEEGRRSYGLPLPGPPRRCETSSAAGSSALCLHGGRIEVKVAWRDWRTGRRGEGRAVELSSNSGRFWFSDEDNVELIVKVLDAGASTGSYWLFAGAVTDLEVDLTITDLEIGRTRKVSLDPGDLCSRVLLDFLPSDTGALPQTRDEPMLQGTARAESSSTATVSRTPWPTAAAAPSAPPMSLRQGSCVADANTLCLQQDRFAVRLSWTNFRNGQTGSGVPVPGTDQSGFFTFRVPDNLEVIVKILDARSFGRFFWVFHGGLTDFEYTLEVTDTLTGASKSYFKAARSLCGEADTAAFE